MVQRIASVRKQDMYSISSVSDMNILLGNCNAKGGRYLRMDDENSSLRETSDSDGVSLINTDFVMSKNRIVKGTLFSDCNIHKYTSTYDGKMHS
jgi:hypothetical protein